MGEDKLPIKTKIAAWITILIGIIGAILYIITGSWSAMWSGWPITYFLFPLLIFICFFLPNYFVLKRKRTAWWFSISILIIGAVLLIRDISSHIVRYYNTDYGLQFGLLRSFYSIVILILFLLIITLFLTDRKNFFKIAS